jgi:hypothetical protein
MIMDNIDDFMKFAEPNGRLIGVESINTRTHRKFLSEASL